MIEHQRHPLHGSVKTERTTRERPAHPLHSQELVDLLNAQSPSGYFHNMHRRTGRTTAIALKVIARAIENPGEPIQVLDHHGTLEADRYLAGGIKRAVELLELRHLHLHTAQSGRITLVLEVRK